MTHAETLADFLKKAGWAGALPENLGGDFSPRHFTRLHRDDGMTAIVMEAGEDQKTPQFVVLAWLLRGLNLSTPEIFADQKEKGLVLMEDFGEGNIGRLLDHKLADAETTYSRAADVLAHLHKNFNPMTVNDLKLPAFTAALFTKQTEKFLEGYAPLQLKRQITEEEKKSFRAAWHGILKPVDTLPQTLILRDFMPDNMMNLPERKAWQSFGILDFQDAGIGPIAYDLASFCEVVRRDGGDKYLNTVVKLYHERAHPACTLDNLQNACLLLAAQRHTRILGILGNIAQKDPQSPKLVYMSRVENYVKQLLQETPLRPVRDWMNSLNLLA